MIAGLTFVLNFDDYYYITRSSHQNLETSELCRKCSKIKH